MISQGFLEERAKKAVNAHHLLPEFIYNIYNTQHTASPYQPEIYSSCLKRLIQSPLLEWIKQTNAVPVMDK